MTAYIRIAALAFGLALLGGAYFKGRADGAAVELARHDQIIKKIEADLDAVAIQTNQSEMKRLEAEAANQKQQRNLQDEAQVDPGADRIAISADSVRRLNQAR